MDNFKIIYKILKFLESSMDNEVIDLAFVSFENLGITKERWIRIIEMLVKNEYIDGIRLVYSDNLPLPIAKPYEPKITLKGLEYLHENSMMKQVYSALKGIKEIIPGI